MRQAEVRDYYGGELLYNFLGTLTSQMKKLKTRKL